MKLFVDYLKPYKTFIAFAFTIKITATLIELIIPYIMSHILDTVVYSEKISNIVYWGAAMLLCALLACVTNIIANRMAAKAARDATERIRHDLFSHTMSLSARQIDKFTIPSLESRLTSDTYHVHHFMMISMRMGVRAPMLLIGGIIVTASLDLTLTLMMILVLPFISATVYVISKKGIPLYKQSQSSVDAMIRIVREDSQGIRVIKALSKTDYEKRKYDTANKKLASDELRASATMAASNPLVSLFLHIGMVAVILMGAFLVNDNLTQPGKIVAFIQYFTLIANAMIGLARIFVNYSKGGASAKRISEVLETEPDLLVHSEKEYPRRDEEGYVVFDDVSFSYIGIKNNLSNISFSLKKGQTLGIIGATGCGKSTLAQLLMRFYDVDSGAIRIDGRDVRTIPHEELNTRFGVVMQNDFIFAGTIAENIRFGRDLSDEQVKRAATLAQAAEFIEQYDDGYEHMLQSKGTNVSGGQKQRLLIARALAGSPDILVLDDSSSALDYKTDAKLRRSIRENMADTTTVVVAQRVSSVMSSDIIIVLEEGDIIGIGTHDELIASCEIYKEISDSQIGGAFLE